MYIDESPPPYSAVIATPESPESDLNASLPFGHSDRLAVQIRALVSEGNTLGSRFKDFHEVASAYVKFEYQVPAITLPQKFETLIWESRSIAGVTLVAVKDFNEIILEFLSEPSATIQDRVKELTNASKLLKRERESAASHRSSLDALIKELEDYSRMIHSDSESGPLVLERRRQILSDGKGMRGTRQSRKSKPPYIVPRQEPLHGLSMIAMSFGTMSRSCMDYALRFERMAEQTMFPSCASSLADAPLRPCASPNRNSGEHSAQASLPGSAGRTELAALVGALTCDVRGFVSHADVFNTVLLELAREQDIFVVYLKDGQSVANQGYRSEINRLRRHLPRVCSALDAYSKAMFS